MVNLSSESDAGARITFTGVNSLAGRVGARFARAWEQDSGRRMEAWVRPNIWHEFRGKPSTQFSSKDGERAFRSDLNGTSGEIDLGVSGQLSRSITLFGNVSYLKQFNGSGYEYGGRAGVRVNW
jgi:outer membrane autotransporter protein